MIFKRFLRKIGSKECGMILPLALILLVVATLIVVPGLGFMYSLLTINSNSQQDVAAYYAADSGIQALYWYWNTNPNNITSTYVPTILNPINGMTVTVAAVDSQAPDKSYDNYTITSSAASGGKTRAKVIALIRVPAAGNNLFNQAAAALNGNITMSSNAKITSDSTSTGNFGNIYANGNISLQDITRVGGTSCPAKGIPSATGTVTTTGLACSGTPVTGAAPVSYTLKISNFTASTDPPTSGITDYTNQAASWSSGTNTYNVGPGFTTSDVTIAGNNVVVLQGNLHVKGNLTIGGNAVVKGPYTVIVDGNLTVSGNSSAALAAGNIPFIICSGTSVNIGGSGGNVAIAAVIYAPNAAATVAGNPNSSYGYSVYGSVIAKSLTISGNAVIEYLNGIHTESQIPGAGLGGTPVLIGYNYQ